MFHFMQRPALFKPVRQFFQLMLAHAVHQQIGTRGFQNGRAHVFIPVIIMGKPAQAGFHTANHQRYIRISLAHQPAVHIHRPVRPQTLLPARRIGIAAARFFGCGVMIHHGVDIAAGHDKPVSRPAKGFHTLTAGEIGLGDNPHPEALMFQQPAHQRCAKAGMIHIGITSDQHKVQFIPASVLHVLPVYR